MKWVAVLVWSVYALALAIDIPDHPSGTRVQFSEGGLWLVEAAIVNELYRVGFADPYYRIQPETVCVEHPPLDMEGVNWQLSALQALRDQGYTEARFEGERDIIVLRGLSSMAGELWLLRGSEGRRLLLVQPFASHRLYFEGPQTAQITCFVVLTALHSPLR